MVKTVIKLGICFVSVLITIVSSFILFGIGLKAVQIIMAAMIILICCITDVKEGYIYDIPLIIAAVISGLFIFFTYGTQTFLSTILSTCVFTGVLILIYFITGKQIGIGDIKVAAVLSLLLSWIVTAVLITLAATLCTVYLSFKYIKLRSRKVSIAFVPFMAIALNIMIFIL